MRTIPFLIALATVGVTLSAQTTGIRTFVNGVPPQTQVFDIHVEYDRAISSAAILTPGIGGKAKLNGKVLDLLFNQAFPSGSSITISGQSTSDRMNIVKWWWTDRGNGQGKPGNPVKRTVIYKDRRTNRTTTSTIDIMGGDLRGDEAVISWPRPPLNRPAEDPYVIVNKRHHWGGPARLTGKVKVRMDARRFLSTAPRGMDRAKLLKNIQAAVKEWMDCADILKHRSVPRSGLGGIPQNHGPGLDPAVMAPGPSHRGAKGAKFRCVCDRECAAALIKYPRGIEIEVVTDVADKKPTQISMRWGGTPGRSLGWGPSQAGRGNAALRTTTVSGQVRMRSGNTKWHLADDTDRDGVITNKDTDVVPADSYDFYSIFKHEVGHVLCFNHAGANFCECDTTHGPAQPLGAGASSPNNDQSPYPTAHGDQDELGPEFVWFASDRPGGRGGMDIWQAAYVDGRWQVTNAGSDVNSSADELDPFVTSDGTTLYFSSNRGPGSDFDLFESSLDLFVDQWGPSAPLSGTVNTSADERHPSLPADMRTLYFDSDRPNGRGSNDIWVSEWVTGPADWSPAQNLGAPVNGSAEEGDPAISGDGNMLYFTSNRPGGRGGLDLWFTSRLPNGWNAPKNVGPRVNTKFDEFESALRLDDKFLAFSSNRPGGMGGTDLYQSPLLFHNSFHTFGTSCSGTTAFPYISHSGEATLGKNLTVELNNARANSAALLLIGFSRTNWLLLPLPFDLNPTWPGCTLLVSADFLLQLLTSGSGTANVPLPVPLVPELIGHHLFFQYMTLDPAATGGLTFTNGGEATIGG